MTTSEDMIGRAFEIADVEHPPSRGDVTESNDKEDARWYSMLRALIIDCFNPPDDDIAECSLLADSVAHAYVFIVEQPCECVPEGPEPEDWKVCRRCDVLGRVGNSTIER